MRLMVYLEHWGPLCISPIGERASCNKYYYYSCNSQRSYQLDWVMTRDISCLTLISFKWQQYGKEHKNKWTKKQKDSHTEPNPWILTVNPLFSIMLWECFSRNCNVPRCFWLEICISPTPYQIRNEIPYMTTESHETSTFPSANHWIKLPRIWTPDLWLTGRNRSSFWDLGDQMSCCSSRQVSHGLKPIERTIQQTTETKNNKLTRAVTLPDQMPSPIIWHVPEEEAPGARFSKAPEAFRARKAIFSSAVSKNGEANSPETSCIKRTSDHVKNMWIKQSCNCKVRDFAMALQARKVSGAFEKRLTPGLSQIPLSSDSYDGSLLLPGTAKKRSFCFFTFQSQHGNKTYLPATGKTRNHYGSAPFLQIKALILCNKREMIKPFCTAQTVATKPFSTHTLNLYYTRDRNHWATRMRQRRKRCTAKLLSPVLRPNPT